MGDLAKAERAMNPPKYLADLADRLCHAARGPLQRKIESGFGDVGVPAWLRVCVDRFRARPIRVIWKGEWPSLGPHLSKICFDRSQVEDAMSNDDPMVMWARWFDGTLCGDLALLPFRGFDLDRVSGDLTFKFSPYSPVMDLGTREVYPVVSWEALADEICGFSDCEDLRERILRASKRTGARRLLTLPDEHGLSDLVFLSTMIAALDDGVGGMAIPISSVEPIAMADFSHLDRGGGASMARALIRQAEASPSMAGRVLLDGKPSVVVRRIVDAIVSVLREKRNML